MPKQLTPTVGRVLHYRLSQADVLRIEECRVRSAGSARGNPPRQGDVVPLHVVKVWPDEYSNWGSPPCLLDTNGASWPIVGPAGVNGQALLDGNDSIWVTSAGEGDGPGQWRWPTRDLADRVRAARDDA